MSTINPKPMADFILKVIGGLETGAIKSQSILLTGDATARSWPMVSLKEIAIQALRDAGYTYEDAKEWMAVLATPEAQP